MNNGISDPDVMKKILFAFVSVILLLFTLLHTDSAIPAARAGMNLWLNTLFPTLLPFIILTGILMRTELMESLFYPARILLKYLFGLSPCGGYALFAGLLCGYPMGAKITSDLYRQGKLSLRESCYLMTFSNNASPAFLTGYVYLTCLKKVIPLKYILFPLIIADITVMLFFRIIIFHRKTIMPVSCVLPKKETSFASGFDAFVDVSIMNGFETMARLGGYILLFSLAGAMLKEYLPYRGSIFYLLTGSMELTNGLHMIAGTDLSTETKYLYSMVLTSFGGLCVACQTRSVSHPHIPLKYYLCAKCINTGITALLILFLRKII